MVDEKKSGNPFRRLPQRVSSHVAEDRSRKFIRNLLPDEWIIRDVSPDYGVDITVEVWSKEGMPLDRTAAIQLKSIMTHAKWLKGVLLCKMNISTIHYLSQFNHSFVVAMFDDGEYIREQTVSFLRVREALDIILPVIGNERDNKIKKSIMIPMVYCRDSYLSHQYYWWCNSHPTWKSNLILGGLNEMDERNERLKYFTIFPTEREFWRREVFANIAHYVASFKPKIKQRAITFLVNAFYKEEGFGKIGILEGLFHLGHQSDDIVSTALEWLASNFAQKPLVAAHYLGNSKNQGCLNQLIYAFLNTPPDSVIEEDEVKDFRRALLKSIHRIGTPSAVSFFNKYSEQSS